MTAGHADGGSTHEDHGSEAEAGKDAAEGDLGTQALVQVPTPSGRVRCVVCSTDPNEEGEACATRPTDFVRDCIAPPTSTFGNYTGCRKIEQWVDYDVNASDPRLSNHHRIIRQCAYFAMRKPCMHSANMGGKQYTCYCQGDACNGAHALHVEASTAWPAILATALLTVSLSRGLVGCSDAGARLGSWLA